MKKILLLPFFLQIIFMCPAQEVISLYARNIPNARLYKGREILDTSADGRLRMAKVSIPTLSVFLPPREKANGTAVIICPGGGYARLAFSHEGIDVAKALNEWGVAAFVLKYRLPDDSIMQDKTIGPLQDAQRAMQLVREQAKKFHVNAGRVGIMGFSAGGHLASTAGTHYDKPVIANPQHTSLRPDFMVLLYPVISFTDSVAHMGSRINLIGKNPSPAMIHYYSNELQVTSKTPPAFLVHAKDDGTVNVQNSISFYEALQKNGVLAEIHLFEKGGHGFGMFNKTSPDLWMNWLKAWMEKNGWVE